MDNYSWSHGWDCGLVCKDVRSSSWTSNELCYQSWWALMGVTLFNLLKVKKKKRKGEGGRKLRPTSSLLLMESAEAELSWIIIFFTWYTDALCVTEKPVNYKSRVKSFFAQACDLQRDSAKAFPDPASRQGGKVQRKKCSHSCVFFTVRGCDGAHAKEQVVPL